MTRIKADSRTDQIPIRFYPFLSVSSAVESSLELCKLLVRKRLAPIELEFISFAIGIKLIERRAECTYDVSGRTRMCKNHFTLGCISLVRRILEDLHQDVSTVPNESKIEFFRIAVPFQDVLIFRRSCVGQRCQDPHQLGKSKLMRCVCSRSMKLGNAILEPDRHPSALRAVKADLEHE